MTPVRLPAALRLGREVTTAPTSTPEPQEPAFVESGKKGWDPTSGTAAVKGTVKFDGAAPRRRPVQMGGDPKCGALHPAAPTHDETVIVNGGWAAEGGMRTMRKPQRSWTMWRLDRLDRRTGATLENGCRYVECLPPGTIGNVDATHVVMPAGRRSSPHRHRRSTCFIFVVDGGEWRTWTAILGRWR